MYLFKDPKDHSKMKIHEQWKEWWKQRNPNQGNDSKFPVYLGNYPPPHMNPSTDYMGDGRKYYNEEKAKAFLEAELPFGPVSR